MKTTLENTVVNEDLNSIPSQALEESPLAEFISKMEPSDGKIMIYRLSAGNNRSMAFVFSFAAGAYSYEDMLETLRDEYGGGDFCIKIHAGEGRRLRMQERVSVESPKVKKIESVQQINSENPMIAMMREQMAAQQSMLNNLLLGLAKRPEPAAVAGLGLVEMLTLMEKMTPKQVDPMQQLTLMRELVDFGKEVSGNAPEDTGFMSAFKALAPAINAIASSQPPQVAPQVKQGNQPPQVAPQIKQGNQRPQAPVDGQEESLVLLKMLVRAAKIGTAPEVYAEVVIDQLGAENCQALINNPDLLKGMLLQMPEAENYSEWFDELLAAMGDFLAQPPNTESPPNGDGEPQ
jgi:hypothetical protein